MCSQLLLFWHISADIVVRTICILYIFIGRKGKKGKKNMKKQKADAAAELEEQESALSIINVAHYPHEDGVSIAVSENVQTVRPFIVAAVVKDLNFNKESNSFKRFLALQVIKSNNLHSQFSKLHIIIYDYK